MAQTFDGDQVESAQLSLFKNGGAHARAPTHAHARADEALLRSLVEDAEIDGVVNKLCGPYPLPP